MSLEASNSLHSTGVPSIKTYGSETWLVEEEDVIKTEMNDARIVKWMATLSLRVGILQRKLRIDQNRIA